MNDMRLPQYQCHKVVGAVKIAHIEPRFIGDGGAIITPADPEVPPFVVDQAYVDRHKPEMGGYYVQYASDGYASYSPGDVFEAGYTKL